MPGLTIPELERDADNLLLEACSKTLRRLGADVRIRAEGENLIRSLLQGSAFAARATGSVCGHQAGGNLDWAWSEPTFDAPIAVIEASGLPNLLHELVHVALAGQLADDHGIDYRAIPYDLGTLVGREVLWDELAACVVSCAYLLGGSRQTASWTRVDGWFDEQLGIQPIFYGMDDAPEHFWSMLPGLVELHSSECRAMSDCAYERVAALLEWGAAYDAKPARLSFAMLWDRRGQVL